MSEPIELERAPTLVLGLDPHEPLPALAGLGEVAVAGELAPGSLRPDAWVPLEELSAWRADPRLRALRPETVVVNTLGAAGLRVVLAALRHGGRRFHFVYSPGAAFATNARGAVALGAVRSLRRRLGAVPFLPRLSAQLGLRVDPPHATLGSTCRAVAEAVAQVRRDPPEPVPAAGPLRVLHYIGQLGPGGAERQLSYLAAGSRAAGHEVSVCTAYPLEGASAHYAPALRTAGVRLQALPAHPRWRPLPALRDRRGRLLPAGRLEALDRHCGVEWILPLAQVLAAERPHVLHCWLDEGNVLGAVAGLLAGVPRVVVSTRNVNPSHFQRFLRPHFAPTYRLLGDAPPLRFVANSRAGAEDYAAWAELPPERFRVIPNGLPLEGMDPVAPAERRAARERAGIPPESFLIAGVFRLDPEKRPGEFLQVLARLRAEVPQLQAVHLGTGTLDAGIQTEARALGLGDALRFLGRVADPASWVRLADATLLCSESEGCPNVSLESQALGVPIVLTDAGGSRETIRPGETGFVRPVGDVVGLAEDLLTLARDPARREAMGAGGRAFIEAEFSLEALIRRSHAVYRA